MSSPRRAQKFFAVAIVLFSVFISFILILSVPSPAHEHLKQIDYSVDLAVSMFREIKPLAWFMVLMTYLGNPELIIAFEIALLAFIMLVHRKRIAGLFLAGIIVGEVTSLFFKSLLERARPVETVFQISRHGYSFPSGHALLATVFYGSLGFFAYHLAPTRKQKQIIAFSTTIIILLVGFSRVYLGVHWASDVIGGFALGGGFLCLIIALFYRLHTHTNGEHLKAITRKERIALMVTGLMVGFFIVFFFVTHLGELRSIL